MAVKPNALKTHCPQGHPLSGENLYEYTSASGGPARQCKTCNRERSRNQAYRRKMKPEDISRSRFNEMTAWPLYRILKTGVTLRVKTWPSDIKIKLDGEGLVRYADGQIYKITDGPIDESKWEIV